MLLPEPSQRPTTFALTAQLVLLDLQEMLDLLGHRVRMEIQEHLVHQQCLDHQGLQDLQETLAKTESPVPLEILELLEKSPRFQEPQVPPVLLAHLALPDLPESLVLLDQMSLDLLDLKDLKAPTESLEAPESQDLLETPARTETTEDAIIVLHQELHLVTRLQRYCLILCFMVKFNSSELSSSSKSMVYFAVFFTNQ